MMNRIARLTAAEFIKLFSQPFLYISLVLLFLATLLAGWLQPILRGQAESVWRSYNSVQLFAYGLNTGLQLATYVLVVFSTMLFAGEFDRGTIKNLLTRPITRADFFVAKCATVISLSAMLFGFVLLVSAFYGLWRGNLGPVWDDGQYIMQRSTAEILGHARKAVAMAILSFLAAGFFGILVSNLTESSGFAVAIGGMVFLGGDLMSRMLTPKTQPKIFLYYGPYAMEKLMQLGEGTTTRWNPDVDAKLMCVTVPLIYIACFVPAAYLIFRSRNITA